MYSSLFKLPQISRYPPRQFPLQAATFSSQILQGSSQPLPRLLSLSPQSLQALHAI